MIQTPQTLGAPNLGIPCVFAHKACAFIKRNRRSRVQPLESLKLRIGHLLLLDLLVRPLQHRWRHPLTVRSQGSETSEDATDVTPRIQLWRRLMEKDCHTLGSLAESVQLSAATVRHHLEHIMKQAQSLKNKSLDWRKRRHIPLDCDASRVRLKILPATCPSCNWKAKSAAKRIMGVRMCKICGSRTMSPVLVTVTCKKP